MDVQTMNQDKIINNLNDVGDALSTTSSSISDNSDSWTLVIDRSKQKRDHKRRNEEHQQTNIDQIENDSDGISVISENDSSGRISPHPMLREHLVGMLPPPLPRVEECQLRRRTHEGTEEGVELVSEEEVIEHQEAAIAEKEPDAAFEILGIPKNCDEDVCLSQMWNTVRKYAPVIIVVIIALVCFNSARKSNLREYYENKLIIARMSAHIEQIELQNNLMRAEIDIISKQVKHLTNLSTEKGHKEPPAAETSSREAAETEEKLTFMPPEKADDIKRWMRKAKVPYRSPRENANEMHNSASAYKQSDEDEDDDDDDDDDENDSSERFDDDIKKYEKQFIKQDEHGNKRQKHKHFNKNKKQGSSEEKYHDDDDVDDEKKFGGHWHEKRMHHREHARKHHEKQQKKNWYLERQDERERERVKHSGERRG